MLYQVLNRQCCLDQGGLDFRVEEVSLWEWDLDDRIGMPRSANFASPQPVTHAYCSSIEKQALCSTIVAGRLSVIPFRSSNQLLPLAVGSSSQDGQMSGSFRPNQLEHASLSYSSSCHGPVNDICQNPAIVEVSSLISRQSVFCESAQVDDGVVPSQRYYSASTCEP